MSEVFVLPEEPATVFVSHTNGAAGVSKVIEALAAALAKPGSDGQPANMQLVWDRGIEAGALWRLRIYEWLEGCPAAVVLISQESFSQGSWVANEAFFLGVRKQVRGDVLVIPVIVGDVGQRLRTAPEFKPAGITEIAWIDCPDPSDEAGLQRVVETICTLLKSIVRSRRAPLGGLARGIARILAACRECHAALAAELGMSEREATKETLAVRLLEADEALMADAVTTFARFAASPLRETGRGPVAELCNLLAAREAPEEAARQLAMEMAKAPSEARAVFVNSTMELVSRLYAARSSGDSRRITFYNLDPVLELGMVETASEAIAKTLTMVFHRRMDEVDAVKSSLEGTKKLRKMGRPPMFRVKIESIATGPPLVEAVRRTAPYCGLLLCSDRDLSGDAWPHETVCKLTPELDEERLDALVGLDAALNFIMQQPE